MKIALGTVQFGMNYGVANSAGKVGLHDVRRILDIALGAGVTTLDTAVSYGESESLLGLVGTKDFDVVTKLPPRGDHAGSARKWVIDHIQNSLVKLNRESLYGLLLHRPLDLMESGGDCLYEALCELKLCGLVKKIGISVYGPEELEKLCPRYDFDIVQAPMNLVDQRMYESGWLDRLKQLEIEIHVRSAFLQGLLLMHESDRPEFFKPWSDLFLRIDEWCRDENVSLLEACLGALVQRPQIDKVVVGVTCQNQLEDILSSTRFRQIVPPAYLCSHDEALINPSMWKL
ncbi:aldo/keto reductase [Salinicola sp. DM10]|uniref:aldo/keto reductase n=1 Tax=Salinicola sp. DM10 TaxID=2815721 RepID=UPI001A8EBDA1|nr:aldo/keto reductase [Salinicola sp. DM10]MCE3025998.1 aldo/keto reductase [Salinicola sp. DM10]